MGREEGEVRREFWPEVWCPFGRDEHQQIPDAFEPTKAEGVRIAFSHPCFEL
ncbi:hypothetical protein [Streptomyces cinereoruber]|uniref:hypothetical protein n=1 Tax=Streptomyces cinereoruber TaxID=67260 RepID=UPI003625E7D0